MMINNKNRFAWVSLALMFIILPGLVAAQNQKPTNSSTSIKYTLIPPASPNWTSVEFDDSAWNKAEDAESIVAVVPKDVEVWIRISCQLPWELINNTYAKIFGSEPVEVYINGKK